MWIAIDLRIKCDRSLVRIVLARQTAGTFARPTASATAAAILKLLWDNAKPNLTHIVSQVVTHEPDQLLRVLFGFVQPKQRFSTQYGECEAIKADALGDLLQVKFDTCLFGVWQIWLWLEKHDSRSQ